MSRRSPPPAVRKKAFETREVDFGKMNAEIKRDQLGEALLQSATSGDAQRTHELIKKGANVNYIDSFFKKTALQIACKLKKVDVVRELVACPWVDMNLDKKGNLHPMKEA